MFVIPPHRTRYLSEISEGIRTYNAWADHQAEVADALYSLHKADGEMRASKLDDRDRLAKGIQEAYELRKRDLDPHNWALIEGWGALRQRYKDSEYVYQVRGKDIKVPTHTKSLSNQDIPKVVTPSYRSWGDILRWQLQENVPVSFRTPRACIHLSARARTPRACLPVRAGQSVPTSAFTTCRSACRRSASRQLLIR
jgi:methylmalonyl-CoA mutase